MRRIVSSLHHDLGSSLRNNPRKSYLLLTRYGLCLPRVRSASTSYAALNLLRRESQIFHNPGSRQRAEDLQPLQNELYPRLESSDRQVSCREFLERFSGVDKVEQYKCQEPIVLHGRVSAIRSAGNRLFFIDIKQDGQRVQGCCNFGKLAGDGVNLSEFRECLRGIQRGDILRVEGSPHRTSTGELSILLAHLPERITPCLANLPTKLEDPETRIRARHVDFIVNPKSAHLLRIRSEIIQNIRQFLLADGQVEVQTPILANSAGGALARSFQTAATEFPDKSINLRIAPELWLKRMIVGGFERVFEIGPSFRNEGLDATHNPEFMTCEFYRTYTDLETLISMTEKLMADLAQHVNKIILADGLSLTPCQIDFSAPYRRLDYITSIEAAMGRKMPPLTEPGALKSLARILEDCSITLPDPLTLPQMLDRLSAFYLEPQCKQPTFIINYPECLSPLAKSFQHPLNGHLVTARAELFVNQQEIANTYEEENSPMEQRRKFRAQLEYRNIDPTDGIDERYLEALEWGLPPTGGWGGGIERICMLMTGTVRIGDVLPFGTLRNVMGLSNIKKPQY